MAGGGGVRVVGEGVKEQWKNQEVDFVACDAGVSWSKPAPDTDEARVPSLTPGRRLEVSLSRGQGVSFHSRPAVLEVLAGCPGRTWA